MTANKPEVPKLKDFPHQIKHGLRYSDCDQQGHVNNAVFASFVEMGRVDILYDVANPLHETDSNYVIANLEINYIAELKWPAEIIIATLVSKVGNSSVTFAHGIFNGEKCVATARSICVHFDTAQKSSSPLSAAVRDELSKYLTT